MGFSTGTLFWTFFDVDENILRPSDGVGQVAHRARAVIIFGTLWEATKTKRWRIQSIEQCTVDETMHEYV